MKKNFAKTRVERANLRGLVTDLIPKLREASVDPSSALQAVIEISNRLCEDVADKIKTEVSRAQKQMLFSLDMKYAGAMGRIRAKAVRDDDELF